MTVKIYIKYNKKNCGVLFAPTPYYIWKLCNIP